MLASFVNFVKKFLNSSNAESFEFTKETSSIFGAIYTPYVRIKIWSEISQDWIEVEMLVDTGADYTILPAFLAYALGIDLEKECKKYSSVGVGGKQITFFYPDLKVKIGKFERQIPVGFINSDHVPPLMGRHGFMETFETSFNKNQSIWFDC